MSDSRWYLQFAWGREPYALDLPEVVIGRGDACPLQIQEPQAGEEHARLVVEEDAVWLEDLRSGAPTLHNGRPVSARVRLADGDFVQIGHSVMTLRGRAVPLRAPSVSALPEARTLEATSLPEQVQRALAERDAATGAKNFVVGEREATPLTTVMMESPLLQPDAVRPAGPRDPQRTVEVNADEILAAIRKNLAPSEAQPSAPAPAPVEPPRPRPTMLGVGPAELGVAATMIGSLPARPAPGAEVTSPRASEHSMPTRVGAEEGETTRVGEEEGETTRVGAEESEGRELAAAPTMIANAPEPVPQRGKPPRSSTSPDITPLPAPLPPPNSSFPELGPLVAAATGTAIDLPPPQGHAGGEDDESARTERRPRLTESEVAPVGFAGAPTQQLRATSDVDQEQTERKPRVPQEAPLHQEKTRIAAAPSPVSKSGPSTAPSTRSPQFASMGPTATVPYAPPKKGPFGSFSRAIDFFQQMRELGKRERALTRPIYKNLAIATPVSLAISALLLVVHSGGAVYGLLGLGTAVLYFIDYYCNAMTASLINDYVTTGKADVAVARQRVKKSLSGIMTFAAVSALLDVAATYARERSDILSKILLRVLHAIWTTATYVIMPAMIIEGVSFKDAFARSKKLMAHDPTGVGAGIVALSMVTYILGAVLFSLAFFLMRIGSHVHPVLGVALYFTVVNLYWAVSGWMKIAYSTCFYLWALRCEAEGRADPVLAPIPLRHAIEAG